jgi:hypothetical protein
MVAEVVRRPTQTPGVDVRGRASRLPGAGSMSATVLVEPVLAPVVEEVGFIGG